MRDKFKNLKSKKITTIDVNDFVDYPDIKMEIEVVIRVEDVHILDFIVLPEILELHLTVNYGNMDTNTKIIL